MLTPRQLDVHWLTDETPEKYGIYWTHDKDDPGHSCPNQRSEASGNQDKSDGTHRPARAANIATSCTPQAPEGPDPVTRISVFVVPSTNKNEDTVINVVHYSLRGNAYEGPKQYRVYTRGLNGGSWQWLGQRFSDASTWMVGELNPGRWKLSLSRMDISRRPKNHRVR
jgi:hypothetical protein